MPEMEWKEVETRACMVCGNIGTIKVPTVEYRQWQLNSMHGRVPGSLPSLTPAEREQLITGVHEVCYLKLFPEHTFDEDEDVPEGEPQQQPPDL